MANKKTVNKDYQSGLKARYNDFLTLNQNEKWKFIGNSALNSALYIILVILVIYVAIVKPDFLKAAPVDILKRSAAGIVMALGVGGIIVLTGTDLSAGRILGLAACVAASLLQSTGYVNKMWPNLKPPHFLVVMLTVMIIGGLIGAFNGFFVSKFSLHPFIVTLATQLILYGLVLEYITLGENKGNPISGLDDAYKNFATGSFLKIGNTPVPNYVWYAILITILMWFVWNKTTLGKNMYAVGANPEAAKVSGVNVAATTVILFTLAGALYGFAGFIDAARIGSNNANTGVGFETDAIAACVIGGVSFTGGVGKISGIITGVIVLNFISIALLWLSVSANMQYIIKGAIILIAVSLDMRKYLAKK